MADEKQGRRVKNTDASAHRAGTKRAAVKPHKRTSEPDVKKAITDYLATLRSGSLTQTYTGDTLVRNAAALRANFGLDASDELYLLNDPTATGKAGVMLSSSGVHIADGRGGKATISWKDFASTTVGYQRGMLVIGQAGVSSRDAQALAGLMQNLQSALK